MPLIGMRLKLKKACRDTIFTSIFSYYSSPKAIRAVFYCKNMGLSTAPKRDILCNKGIVQNYTIKNDQGYGSSPYPLILSKGMIKVNNSNHTGNEIKTMRRSMIEWLKTKQRLKS